MRDEYDGIVLGAGHNGLILQAYLCRAGLRVLALERLPQAGGPLVTDPDPRLPGVHHNVHAVFLRGISGMPWFRDLELARHGVRVLDPELNLAQVTRDGRMLGLSLDLERTLESLAAFSVADARTYRDLHERYRPVIDAIVAPERAAPPWPAARRRALLERSRVGRLALATEAFSAREFVERHFEHPVIRAALLHVSLIRDVDIHAPGHGLVVPSIIAGDPKAQLCAGGSARLAGALVKDVEEHGGTIVTGADVSRIVVDRARAAAVELQGGERIAARAFIALALNPHQLLELVGPQHVPVDFARQAREYRYSDVGPLFGVNVALREPPAYRAAGRYPELQRAGLTVLGLDDPEELHELARGQRPMLGSIWGTTVTAHDPSQAAGDIATAVMWQKVPYALDGDPRHWETRKAAHAETILARWREFAPNVDRDNILSMLALSPVDTERRFPNFRRADLGVGWAGPGQLGDERPFPGAGAYAMPLPGLYLCGAATHPGGNITGLPGHNAALVIARDIGLTPWWAPVDPGRRWQELPP
jgi:phytoene dehydrogenase-like protein